MRATVEGERVRAGVRARVIVGAEGGVSPMYTCTHMHMGAHTHGRMCTRPP